MKTLFTDIDGTLTDTISGSPFKQSPSDIKIIEGADKAIAHYASRNWLIIGISNQGGVAAGHKSLESVYEEFANTLNLFPGLHKIYFCPDFEGKTVGCVYRTQVTNLSEIPGYNFRKPEPGMIKYCLDTHDCEKPWMVGDRPEDEQCASNAGIDFCPANLWRSRFLKGIQAVNATPKQLEFLEGLKF